MRIPRITIGFLAQKIQQGEHCHFAFKTYPCSLLVVHVDFAILFHGFSLSLTKIVGLGKAAAALELGMRAEHLL